MPSGNFSYVLFWPFFFKLRADFTKGKKVFQYLKARIGEGKREEKGEVRGGEGEREGKLFSFLW